MSRNGKFIFGAMLGALFGLAFAPKKGSELRKELQEELEKGGKGEKTLKKNAVVMGKDISSTAKEVYEDPQVQTAIKKGKKEAVKIVDQVKKEIHENGEEWVKMTKEKLMEGKGNLEKETSKAFDSIKKKVTPKKNSKK
ncbi:YtxH domain-containing protein [Candidatus Peregrinibacteria bacterium]|nr:YtxH domain-containing protein [Candidatus Peregrinibacteria bacterium]